MRLPEELEKAVAGAVTATPGIVRAAAALSERYRERQFATAALRSDEEKAAYLLVRMPATYAAVRSAMEQAREAIGEAEIVTVLDLGAGPGTATWAASEIFPGLRSAVLLERDEGMRGLGKRIMASSQNAALRNATWKSGDLSRELPEESADLVVLSYLLGELPETAAEKLVRRSWEKAAKLLLLVEPGTKAGFATIERLRRAMIRSGVKIAAPCPHENECPMAAAGDWCHFSERLDRSSEHRRIKGAELGYEDEKFSYVAFAKLPVQRTDARIVRHPLYRPKQVQLTLCAPEGLRRTVVTKSQGERYRAAKKAEWGDGFEP